MSITVAIWCLLIAIASSSPAGLGAGPVNHKLDSRNHPVSCGFKNLFPCAAGQTCYTSNNQAFCGVATLTVVDKAFQMFTTTITIEATTITSTYSSEVGGSTGSSGTCAADQTICNGPAGLCCNSATQWCDNGNACRDFAAVSPVQSPGLSPGLPSPTLVTVTVSGAATTISNFVAPTSLSTSTITSTSTGTATTTEPFQTPVGSSGASLPSVTAEPQTGGGGLSSGAIAGIVIGVLVGLFIVFIVLTCLCCKGIFDAIFGTKKKKTTETYIHSHHSAHESGARPPPRRFFGILPGKVDSPDRPEKKSSGLGGLFAVGGILTALLIILGLKRKTDRRREEEKSEYTVSEDYYYDDYTTSASSASSDRRTRNTHQSRSQRR